MFEKLKYETDFFSTKEAVIFAQLLPTSLSIQSRATGIFVSKTTTVQFHWKHCLGTWAGFPEAFLKISHPFCVCHLYFLL